MTGKSEKNTALYSAYTDSLIYLSHEAKRDGLDTVASEIEKTRKKIELLNQPNANDNSHESE